jgi:precorrin-6B methylase 1
MAIGDSAVQSKQQIKRRRASQREHRRVACIPGFSSEEATAAELGQAVRTLRLWRKQGKGPPYAKIGRQVHYPDAGRAAWAKSQIVNPVREKAAA